MRYRFLVPDVIRDTQTAIVMGNGHGDYYGELCHEGELGNLAGFATAARKAQAIANRFGYLTLGYERPGSGNQPFNPLIKQALKPTRFTETMAGVGDQLQYKLAQKGIQRIIVAEHSGSVVCGAAFVATESLRGVSHMVATEPHLEFATFLPGLVKYSNYQLRIQRGHALPPRPEGEELLPASLDMARRSIRDAVPYAEPWGNQTALHLLTQIGVERRDTALKLVLAEQGHNRSPQRVAGFLNHFNSLRMDDQNGRPCTAEVWPDATHAWFDNSRIFGDVLEKTLDDR